MTEDILLQEPVPIVLLVEETAVVVVVVVVGGGAGRKNPIDHRPGVRRETRGRKEVRGGHRGS